MKKQWFYNKYNNENKKRKDRTLTTYCITIYFYLERFLVDTGMGWKYNIYKEMYCKNLENPKMRLKKPVFRIF